jgi:hypothetical protein
MTHAQERIAKLSGVQTVALWAGLLAALGGCGTAAGPACNPVRGQVRWNGQPLAEAQVVFHPQAAGGQTFPKPIGTTDPQGNFALTTFQAHDGAPAGDFLITVELRDLRQVGEETVRDGRNLLPERFGRPQESGLRFTVAAGENVVPALEIPAR